MTRALAFVAIAVLVALVAAANIQVNIGFFVNNEDTVFPQYVVYVDGTLFGTTNQGPLDINASAGDTLQINCPDSANADGFSFSAGTGDASSCALAESSAWYPDWSEATATTGSYTCPQPTPLSFSLDEAQTFYFFSLGNCSNNFRGSLTFASANGGGNGTDTNTTVSPSLAPTNTTVSPSLEPANVTLSASPEPTNTTMSASPEPASPSPSPLPPSATPSATASLSFGASPSPSNTPAPEVPSGSSQPVSPSGEPLPSPSASTVPSVVPSSSGVPQDPSSSAPPAPGTEVTVIILSFNSPQSEAQVRGIVSSAGGNPDDWTYTELNTRARKWRLESATVDEATAEQLTNSMKNNPAYTAAGGSSSVSTQKASGAHALTAAFALVAAAALAL